MSTILDKIRNGARIIDVRSREEFEDGHYHGAVNVPVDAIQRRLADLGAKTDSYVLYCASGARSAYATRLLRSAGFVDVVNAGGLEDMPS